ncbi:MAG: zinc ribbon domain-containing protein [Microcoleaceae cyanobacterium]
MQQLRKSLSTRTHSCPNCKFETCRDTAAAMNILQRGMNILGHEWNIDSTLGHGETAPEEGTTGESPATDCDGKPEQLSSLVSNL